MIGKFDELLGESRPRTPVVKHGENGHRVEDSHHAAKLTRAQVDLILELHEDHGMGYRRLRQFVLEWFEIEVSRALVQQICCYRIWVSRPTMETKTRSARRREKSR